MRNLNDKYYQALSAPERVLASIEAEARGDTQELHRLKETAPRKVYEQVQAEYVNTMMELTTIVIALEHDMLAQALTHEIANRTGNHEMAERAMQTIANLEHGRLHIFHELGVSKEIADQYGPPRHPVLEYLVSISPEPNERHLMENKNLMNSLSVLRF